MKKSDYIPKIKRVSIFRCLTDEELEDLLEFVNIVIFEEGSLIVTEGEVSPFFFSILEGTVHVSVKKDDRDDVYISALGEGDIFGEAGLFMKVARTANVTSDDQTTLLRMHRRDLFEFVRDHHTAGMKIFLLIIFSLLKKLKSAGQELAFERRELLGQEDIDKLVSELTSKVEDTPTE